jgi:hypothetical protein
VQGAETGLAPRAHVQGAVGVQQAAGKPVQHPAADLLLDRSNPVWRHRMPELDPALCEEL